MSSAAVKNRPASGRTSNSDQNPALTAATGISSAFSATPTASRFSVTAAATSKEAVQRCRSLKRVYWK